VKSILPKRLLKLDLTDEQKTKCEAAYKEIFTPGILAKRKELKVKLKGLEKGSEEFKTLRKQTINFSHKGTQRYTKKRGRWEIIIKFFLLKDFFSEDAAVFYSV
jgi:hypothetical protein